MPSKIVKINDMTLTLDARPDRLDIRDLPYRPPVENLPPIYPSDKEVKVWLPAYLTAGLILDQKNEGACTGFGLAAVINFLGWIESAKNKQPMGIEDLVSPRMLYQLARFYDEWPGEDYEGSSCRGALKGWQRHGVCLENLWPYNDGKFVRPKDGWEVDAIRRPLGVYYRIQRDSVVDMQSAIWQTGAIYVSANVHQGWQLGTSSKRLLPTHKKLPVIKPSPKILGGHAFALVGYNDIGFIVQNSWGSDWGWSGFAILPYDDWVTNGSDAWVVGLGVPVSHSVQSSATKTIAKSPQHFVSRSGRIASPTGLPSWVGALSDPLANRRDVWDKETAYWHTLVTGNDGCIINRLPHTENEQDNMRFVGYEQPLEWFKKQTEDSPWRLAIYAHGGLNSESASLERIRVLGPNFETNGVFPIFVTWKSGWMETIGDMLKDKTEELFGTIPPPARGITDTITESTDRAIEVISRNLLVRSMWSEMKENVTRSSDPGRGLYALADQIKALAEASNGKLEIHLIGHSAGSFVCGRLLKEFGDAERGLSAASCSLFAPACDLEFAFDHFAAAIKAGRLNRNRFLIHALSDSIELGDTVGPYRKSLLYLVSRALERWHKTPILGMAAAFDSDYLPAPDCKSSEFWHVNTCEQLLKWQNFFWEDKPQPGGFAKDGKGGPFGALNILTDKQIDTGAGLEKSSHGCFDNSIKHIGNALEVILGGKLRKRLTPLNY